MKAPNLLPCAALAVARLACPRAAVQKQLLLTAVTLLASTRLWAGPYAPAAGQSGSTAIPISDPSFMEWASSLYDFVRGPQNIANPGTPASFGTPSNALGTPNGTLVSLGDGGSITLGFAQPIFNGPGFDFGIVENGFASGGAGMAFLELGFVDVSSDGVNFFRFPSVSLTQTNTQLGNSGTIDASNLYDLAGKYIAGYATPFDLHDMVGVSPLLNVNNVQYVRVVDVVGSINPTYATLIRIRPPSPAAASTWMPWASFTPCRNRPPSSCSPLPDFCWDLRAVAVLPTLTKP